MSNPLAAILYNTDYIIDIRQPKAPLAATPFNTKNTESACNTNDGHIEIQE